MYLFCNRSSPSHIFVRTVGARSDQTDFDFQWPSVFLRVCTQLIDRMSQIRCEWTVNMRRQGVQIDFRSPRLNRFILCEEKMKKKPGHILLHDRQWAEICAFAPRPPPPLDRSLPDISPLNCWMEKPTSLLQSPLPYYRLCPFRWPRWSRRLVRNIPQWLRCRLWPWGCRPLWLYCSMYPKWDWVGVLLFHVSKMGLGWGFYYSMGLYRTTCITVVPMGLYCSMYPKWDWGGGSITAWGSNTIILQ